MKCYSHHERDAFGTCNACGKALCLECAEEYKGYYICKDSESCKHIADVKYVNYFKDNSEFEEDDLPISISGPLQDAPDAIIQFPRRKQDEGQSGRPEQDGIPVAKEIPAYCEQLNAFIRPKWNAVAPTGINLNVSTWPIVNLTIAKDGRISKATIASKSGNKAIDAAVDALLADLKVVPIPPLDAEISVVLEIR